MHVALCCFSAWPCAMCPTIELYSLIFFLIWSLQQMHSVCISVYIHTYIYLYIYIYIHVHTHMNHPCYCFTYAIMVLLQLHTHKHTHKMIHESNFLTKEKLRDCVPMFGYMVNQIVILMCIDLFLFKIER
jgi:hypothetical protein